MCDTREWATRILIPFSRNGSCVANLEKIKTIQITPVSLHNHGFITKTLSKSYPELIIDRIPYLTRSNLDEPRDSDSAHFFYLNSNTNR